jgi:hypothetical protein
MKHALKTMKNFFRIFHAFELYFTYLTVHTLIKKIFQEIFIDVIE